MGQRKRKERKEERWKQKEEMDNFKKSSHY